MIVIIYCCFRNLCDQQQNGRLNQDQFVIAMQLISMKIKGVELPVQVTPEMIFAASHDAGFGVCRHVKSFTLNYLQIGLIKLRSK